MEELKWEGIATIFQNFQCFLSDYKEAILFSSQWMCCERNKTVTFDRVPMVVEHLGKSLNCKRRKSLTFIKLTETCHLSSNLKFNSIRYAGPIVWNKIDDL